MHRNTFGDPRPNGYAEMDEAIEERNPDRHEMVADISHEEGDGEGDLYAGYCAEVRTAEEGDEVFSSLGYAERDDLIKDLAAAGITEVNDL